jgi:hypothetical protein
MVSSIGPLFRFKREGLVFHLKSQGMNEIFQYMVRLEPHPEGADLQGNMTVAQVIARPAEDLPVLGSCRDHGLGPASDLDKGSAFAGK